MNIDYKIFKTLSWLLNNKREGTLWNKLRAINDAGKNTRRGHFLVLEALLDLCQQHEDATELTDKSLEAFLTKYNIIIHPVIHRTFISKHFPNLRHELQTYTLLDPTRGTLTHLRQFILKQTMATTSITALVPEDVQLHKKQKADAEATEATTSDAPVTQSEATREQATEGLPGADKRKLMAMSVLLHYDHDHQEEVMVWQRSKDDKDDSQELETLRADNLHLRTLLINSWSK